MFSIEMVGLHFYLSLLGFSLVYCQIDIEKICQDRAGEGLDFLRHPLDCHSYIGCEEPVYIGACDDFYFNEQAQQCDEKDNVQCDSNPEPQPETTTASTTTTTTTTAVASTSSTSQITEEEMDTKFSEVETDATDELETTDFDLSSTISTSYIEKTTTIAVELPECPEDNQIISFLPSQISCETFFFCLNGVPLQMKCAENLHFNPAKEKCDFKENIKCNIGRPQCDRTMNKFFAHESSCNMFYYCRFGHLTVQRCPFFYNWNDEKNECQLNYGEKCS